MLEILSQGLPGFLTPQALMMVTVGTFAGLIIGVLPGLGPLMGIVLLTPIAVYLDQVAAMSLLVAVYVGGSCGGAVSAILLRIPGTPLAAATLLDGYPMAAKGKSGEAIGLAVAASAVGGIIGGIFLVFLSPLLANVALKFGPFEYFAITLMGLLSVSIVSQGSAVKGLTVAALGLFIATFGADKFSQYNRFTFGTDALLGGFHIVAVIVGLFAFSEMFLEIERGGLDEKKDGQAGRVPFFKSLGALVPRWKNLLRSSTVGTLFGILPGAGGVISSFTSYAIAKSNAGPDEKFGEGEPNGVIATESANNACCGGALIPSFALGVPGDAAAAVLMGSLILIGYFPGPTLFENHIDIVGGIFLAYLFANVALAFLGIWLAPLFAFTLRIKKRQLIPIITVLAIVGTFSIRWSVFDLWTMLGFGIIGYLLRRANYPLAPVVIGLVLGPICEENLRRSLLFSNGDYGIFFERPISATIMAINVAVFTWIFVPPALKAKLMFWKSAEVVKGSNQ
ncbi:tripartite tricarboxylate transporter permease [Pacificoceanicola onchidii]|uniref:tripartite tricarboxylate transporter permease n=1 Tax=Pacificoceanicola onchidii TaxID=2562685 RepID=UPI0010A67E50|nr:tripartite tricarboxylate transporter permease [Pacificoceanicola onchidii]